MNYSGKKYLDISCYDATQQRLEYIFNEFDNILVAFSGGKDSGVLLNLTYDYAKKTNQLDKLAMYFLDYEVQYTETIKYVKREFNRLNDIKRFWLCLPNSVQTITSATQSHWIPWEKSKKDLWVRDMPDYDYVINEDNVPFQYNVGCDDYKSQDLFNKWFSEEFGQTCVLVGIRAQESLDRYRAIKSSRKVNGYKDSSFIIKKDENVYNGYPIYDWNTSDIWKCNGLYEYDYNKLYDLYYKAGVPIEKMRVASPFNSYAQGSLSLYKAIEPELWGKMVSRVNGVNFMGIYESTNAMAFNKISLPKGYTWKEYVQFLLSTLPEETRKNYERIFKVSEDFWKNKGGALSDETIEEIQEKGLKIHTDNKTNRKTDKKIVTFDEYPDSVDVKDFRSVPSYKRMAITIMRNDHIGRYMGFSRTKEQERKRKEAIQKYKDVL